MESKVIKMDKMYVIASVVSKICFIVAIIAIATGSTDYGITWIAAGLCWMNVQIERKGN
jgi:hypothetical protein